MITPARPKVAYNDFYAVSGMTWNWTHVGVHVKNIAYSKIVQLHYKGIDGFWHDSDLVHGGYYGNFNVFGGGNAVYTNEFVIRYLVDGVEYWDNNGGQNYPSPCVGGNIMLKKAVARIGTQAGGGFTVKTSWMEGEIYVSNISFNKKAVVRYSVDNGLTFSDADAIYAGKQKTTANAEVDAVEIWKFKTPELNYNNASDAFRFALYYQRLDPGPSFGATFWDNNFGEDYFLSKVDGSQSGE